MEHRLSSIVPRQVRKLPRGCNVARRIQRCNGDFSKPIPRKVQPKHGLEAEFVVSENFLLEHKRDGFYLRLGGWRIWNDIG
ncbi:hypothetical protein SAMN05216367_5156 [Tardiphaga sp. OK245]|nr:hypothetical protein SAMN05216367_5156 [Tardiphaga sp. OK245]